MNASPSNILSTETMKGEKWCLCPKQAFRLRNVGLGIFVRDVDINDGVGIALPEMADQEIDIKAIVLLLVVACDSGDLDFLWVKLRMESKLDLQQGLSHLDNCHVCL
eukprot:15366915-Ditylum_brightwellii.AAC.1